jgi:hypothetical protein
LFEDIIYNYKLFKLNNVSAYLQYFPFIGLNKIKFLINQMNNARQVYASAAPPGIGGSSKLSLVPPPPSAIQPVETTNFLSALPPLIPPTGNFQTISVDIMSNMNDTFVRNVLDPVLPQDVATKNYVDTHGGGSTPGGINTDIQYNNSGSFGGSNNFTWNNGTNVFTVLGDTHTNTLKTLSLILQDSIAPSKLVTINASTSTSGSYNLILPINAGTNGQVLTTDGTGILSWDLVSGGDVVGPVSSTDNAISRFDGITGKLIQNSVVIIDDTGIITGGTWNGGIISEIYGGTNQSMYTLGDTLYASATNTLSKLSGNVTTTKKFLSQTGTSIISNAPSWSTISGSDIIGSALTSNDDANITLTLGGSPTTALLQTSSITAGWTGQLSLIRGGTNNSLTASAGGIVWSDSTKLNILSGTSTSNQVLLSGSSITPSWSTATYPATTTINQLLYSSANNIIGGLTTQSSASLVTDVTGIPVYSSTMTNGQLIVGQTGSTPTSTSISGDATLAASGVLTLATVNTNVGTFGSATQVAQVTLNAKGLVTAASNVTITGVSPGSLALTQNHIFIGNVSNVAADVAMSGDATIVSSGALTLATVNASPGSTMLSSITTNAKGLVTSNTTGNLTGDVTSTGLATTYNNIVPLTKGGTNANLTASNGGIFYSTASTGAILSGTSTANQVLLSGSSITPSWSNATYPATTTINQLLYSSSANTIGGLTTQNSASLVTGSTGTPVYSSTMTNGQLIVGQTGSTPTSTSVSGDATLAASGVLTLSTVNTNVGTFGSATQVAQVTLNAKGLVTAASNVTITGVSPGSLTLTQGHIFVGNVSNVAADVAMSGDATIIASGVLTLATVNASSGSTTLSSITTNAKGLVTSNTTGNLTGDVTSTGLATTYNNIVPSAKGGTGINNGTSTLTLGGNLTTSGAFNSTFTMTALTSVTFPTSGTLATTSQLPTPAALTVGNDTNITLTLGGTPNTALLQASSITAGWSGQLSLSRGGTNANLTASNGGIFYSTASAGAILSGTSTANQVLLSGLSTTPAWSTATYPGTTTVNQLLYSSAANTIGGLTTANSASLVTSTTGIPVYSSTMTNGQLIIGQTGATPASTSISGDATLASSGALTLATVNSNVGTFGSGTQVAQVTLNAKGLVTAASNVTITGVSPGSLALTQNHILVGNVSNVAADVAMSGDATIVSSGALTLATVNASSGSTTLSSITTNAKGLVTSNTTGNLTGAVTSTGLATTYNNVVPIAKGGTNVTSVTIVPTATAFAGWDANSNLSANNLLEGYSTTVTAAGTTTLVVGSAFQQYFTGTTTQTVVMPVTGTLVLGQQWNIINNSTGLVTVQSSGLNNIIVLSANTQTIVTCILASGTTSTSWSVSNFEVTAGSLGLTQNHILVGNASNVAADVAMSGDATIVSSGALTLATVNGSSGSTTLSSITTNAKGLVTSNTTGNLTGDVTSVGLATTYNNILSLAKGGTNANLTASNGGIFYSTASAGAILAGTATANRILQSGSSTTPAWSTATYPATTTINQLLYSSADNTVQGLTTANSSVLTTNGTGVPSLGTTLPTITSAINTSNSTASTSTITGSLIASGGAGIAGVINSGNGKAYYHSNTPQTITTVVQTAILYPTNDYSTFGTNLAYSAGLFTNNSGHTMYLIVSYSFRMLSVPSGTNQINGTIIVAGGSPFFAQSGITQGVTGNNDIAISGTSLVQLANGVSFGTYAYQSSGGSLTISGASTFQISTCTIYQVP